MSEKDKLGMLEEMLELDEGILSPSTLLEDLDEWDSIAVLSFIALMDDEFNKEIKGSVVKGFKSVSDVLNVME